MDNIAQQLLTQQCSFHHQRHHCLSQGTPSLLPSILVPGQFFKKKVASSQEVICEQWILPSHRYRAWVPLLIALWLPAWLLGVIAFPIVESSDSSALDSGCGPIKITGGVCSDCGAPCLVSRCAARHSQGGTTTASFHIPFFCCLATPSCLPQSEQNFSRQVCR